MAKSVLALLAVSVFAVACATPSSQATVEPRSELRATPSSQAAVEIEQEPCKWVSMYGTTLRLGTVLDQLARHQNLTLTLREGVDARQMVVVPSVVQVCPPEALEALLAPTDYGFEIDGASLTVFRR